MIMAAFDTGSSQTKVEVPAGTVLLRERSAPHPLIIVHSGLVELLTKAESTQRRFSLIKGEAVCYAPRASDAVAAYSLRTRTPCVITTVVPADTPLAGDLAAQPALAVATLRGLTSAIESAGYLFRNYKYLWHKVASICDSIALAYDYGPEILDPAETDRTDGRLPEYSAYVRAQAGTQTSELPSAWDPAILGGAVQDQLDLYRKLDAVTIEGLIDLEQFRFLRTVLAQPNQLVGALAQDTSICSYTYARLQASLETLLQRNRQIAGEINTLLQMLLEPGGWIDQAVTAAGSTNRGFLKALAVYNLRYYKDAVNLLGRDLRKEYPTYASLRTYAKEQPVVRTETDADTPDAHTDVAGEPEAVPSSSGSGLAKYRDLSTRLLDFAGWDGEERQEFEELLALFRESNDKLGDDRQLVHVRSRLAVHFWKLYEDLFFKVLSTDLKAFVPGIMLHFGVFDETLLSEQELQAIDQAYAGSLYVDDPVPTMTLPYFLEKIYQGEQNPSMSEMGEDFQKVLKNQERMTKKDREGAYLYHDTPEDRVRYEIRQIAAHTAALLFGSRRRYSPALCSPAIIGRVDRQMLHPESLAREIEEYRSRDFTVFARDVGLHHKFGTDIVQKEVIPNFVVFPTAGSRMMMWQELDGNSRHSRGRLFVPLVFNEKREEALLSLLSQFKWELQKTVAGANWMDPVEGGMVGTYYDYISFYQKNHKLSSEAKERIKSLVKKTRSDRDRFSSDYVDWVLHEYDGKIRLNPVAREIFYRFCPFPQAVRSELEKKPLYGDLEHKYQNRQRKALMKIESRFKRFEKENEPVPEDLERHLAFLKA